MARLIINGVAEPIELQTGTYRVGRTESNDIIIQDDSVSSHHCELTYTGNMLIVRDVGSTNGTCINNQRVIESPVKDGAILKIGFIEVLYEADAQAESPAVPDGCTNHPSTHSTWVCQKCGSRWCAACVKKQNISMRTLFTCPACDGFCITAQAHRSTQALKNASFSNLAAKAFAYPLKGTGLMILFAGALVYSIFGIIPGGMFLGVISLVVSLVATGYFFAFMQSIVTSSASGEDKLPDWPDITHFADDIVAPFVQFLAIALICIVPGVVLANKHMELWSLVAFGVGAFCSPMAILAVSMTESIAGLNPLLIIPSIFKVFGVYCVACLVMGVVFGVYILSQKLAETIVIPGVTDFIATLIEFYFFSVEMRILGVLYFTRKHQLGWFH
jgi:hypothetical protein